MKFITDEHVDSDVVRGVLARDPAFDIVTMQEVGLRTAADPDILAWAADNERILVTQDRKTMNRHAFVRVQAGLPMPGVVMARRRCTTGQMIESLLTVARDNTPDDLANRIVYVPF